MTSPQAVSQNRHAAARFPTGGAIVLHGKNVAVRKGDASFARAMHRQMAG
jgi:hypothetical protein